jgi:hypothetical protein
MIERKVAELSERLVAREKETIDALASSAVLEADLKAALKEYDLVHSFRFSKLRSFLGI